MKKHHFLNIGIVSTVNDLDGRHVHTIQKKEDVPKHILMKVENITLNTQSAKETNNTL